MNGIKMQSTGIDAAESIGQRIVTTVADEIDADPIEIDPLYETIDPEAIGQLFHSEASVETDQRSRIVFTYVGCKVTVYANDEIDVTKLATEQVDQAAVTLEETQSTAQSD